MQEAINTERRGSIDPILMLNEGPPNRLDKTFVPKPNLTRRVTCHFKSNFSLRFLRAIERSNSFSLKLIILFLFVLLIIMLTVVCLLANRLHKHASSSRWCQTQECSRHAALMLLSLNMSADPCVDFYQYACGGFTYNYPRGKHLKFSVREMISDFNRERMEELVEELPHDDSFVGKLRAFYHSCLSAKMRGFDFSLDLIELISKLGGMQLFDSWNSQRQFSDVFYALNVHHETECFFRIHRHNNLTFVLYPYIHNKLFDKFFHPTGANYRENVRENFNRSIVKVFTYMALKLSEVNSNFRFDSNLIDQLLSDVLYVEQSLFKLQSMGVSPDRLTLARRWPEHLTFTFNQLQRFIPQVNWPKLFRTLYGDRVNIELVRVRTMQSDHLARIGNLLANISALKQQNYMMYRLIRTYLPFLGPVAYTQQDEIAVNLDVTSEAESPGGQCILLMQKHMELAMQGTMFHYHIGTEQVKQSKWLVNKLMSFLELKLNWLPPSERMEIIRSIRSISTTYGFKNEVSNVTYLNKFYEKLDINSTRFFKNFISVRMFNAKMNAKRREFGYPLYTRYKRKRNIFEYDSFINELVVPFEILQAPWFITDKMNAINLGAIGVMIIEQVYGNIVYSYAHSFGYPRLNKYVHCIANLYGMKMPEILQDEVMFQPVKTHLAYDIVYHMYKTMNIKMAALERDVLRTLAILHSSEKEAFAISFAQSRCQNVQPLAHEFRDYHHDVVSQQRLVNTIVQADDEFLHNFHCKIVSNKLPATSCTL